MANNVEIVGILCMNCVDNTQKSVGLLFVVLVYTATTLKK